jgi:8-oxo-dGTP pyrophosphatase MutT (NUDIX family)
VSVTVSLVGARVEREVRAAGAVLWRPGKRGESEIALVHRPKYDDWSLPKGKLDEGEPEPVAAAREVQEETGSSSRLGPFVAEVRYPVGDETKVVGYYSAQAVDGEFTPGEEVDELRWVPVSKAAKLLSYPRDAEVVDAFLALGTELTTVLLVRHAKAGSRDGWTGDDDLRPLSPAGELQAKGLRGLLGLFGPDRVYAAPRLRCVQTVRGVAAELDVTIGHEQLLSEEEYWRTPAKSIDRLREIVAEGGTPVVCSQGRVIPDLIARLSERDGIPLAAVAAKKASTWMLSFRTGPDGPQLATARYIPPPPVGDS